MVIMAKTYIFLQFLIFAIVFVLGFFVSNTWFSTYCSTFTAGGIQVKDVLLIPDEEELNKMSELEHLEFYLKYINTIQVLCRNVIRIGTWVDGGKEICSDDSIRPKDPCLIYSFGIADNWDFDNHAVEEFGCEVHCFDPSIKRKTGQVSSKIWFYSIGLGDTNKTDKRGWKILPLEMIKKELGHTQKSIDILKIDIEGDEFAAVKQMVLSGVLSYVKQIAMEIHYPMRLRKNDKSWRDDRTNIPLTTLRLLYEAGFRICMRDRNIRNIRKNIPFIKHPQILLYEVTLVNLKYHYANTPL